MKQQKETTYLVSAINETPLFRITLLFILLFILMLLLNWTDFLVFSFPPTPATVTCLSFFSFNTGFMVAATGFGVFSFDTKLKLTSLSTLKEDGAAVLAGLSFFLCGIGVLPLDFCDIGNSFFHFLSFFFTSFGIIHITLRRNVDFLSKKCHCKRYMINLTKCKNFQLIFEC